MKVGEIRRIVQETFGKSWQPGAARVFVRGGEIIVRRDGQSFRIEDDARHMADELAIRGVEGTPRISWVTRGVHSFQVVDVVISREVTQP